MSKIAITCLAVSLLVAPAAVAQDWSGASIGLDVAASGLVRSDVSGQIVPGQAKNFVYTKTSPNRSINVDRSTDPQVGAALSYGYLWDRDSIVWGLEGELGYGGKHEFEVGPYAGGNTIATGPGTQGSLTGQKDTISSELNLTAGLILKASAGLKLGDRMLVSVFAGPSIVQADVKTMQKTDYSTLHVSLPPGSMHFNYSYGQFTESVSASRNETLIGGVLGVEARYRLTERMLVRAQGGIKRYGSVDIRVNAGGGDTRLSVDPMMAMGSVGLLYRF